MVAFAKQKTAVTTGASLPVLLALAGAAVFLVVGSISSNATSGSADRTSIMCAPATPRIVPTPYAL